MTKKLYKEIGSLSIHSVLEEDSGVIKVSLNETGYVEVSISETHEHGMIAEIDLTFEEYERVLKAVDKANDILLSDIFHQERYTVDFINVSGSSLNRQGFISVNVFEHSIILVVSLTRGADADIMIGKEEISLLVSLFKKVEMIFDNKQIYPHETPTSASSE
ncbi:hypothetical protein YDYSY3_02520 [Paenibacillus chitinolyticus]|uniref:hypothetical protein n=1 Tax=Paenibacillus chitinolyticus TaxID=79263 RepID=UPI0026E50580|nr:hypothetical protein [Paenibacillus chitinolyticus]GKS09252.1 hypothetical protein YDYSY3_02520 [Paenibacillus chitinolyticus]